ncbi:MAG: large subunit ribosomal protein [Actinomycetota bacterium]|jgi:large subunit ribosomal protein L15|nr:large subunit ribosomal protein [Actinomycetota bacterium]
MKPHDLKPAEGSNKKKRRVGRGDGSGRGKTAGRGTKGSRARGEVHIFFEGGQMPLARRVPKLKGFTPPQRTRYGVVNLDDLQELKNDPVGPDELRAAGLVHKSDKLIKVLAGGSLERKVTVRAHAFSATAKERIEAAGGSAEIIEITPTRSTGEGA